jgi:hypothetical protein
MQLPCKIFRFGIAHPDTEHLLNVFYVSKLKQKQNILQGDTLGLLYTE